MSFASHSLFGITGILGVALLCTPLHSQTPNVPPGYIDGAKTPQLIPDSAAYRMVLLSLRLPQPPSEKDVRRQASGFKHIGFSDADSSAAQHVLDQFEADYQGWESHYLHQKDATDLAVAKFDREAIVNTTTARLLNQLSPAGAIIFKQFVQAAKTRMVVQE